MNKLRRRKADTFVPEGRMRWTRTELGLCVRVPDNRERCVEDGKVVFTGLTWAKRAAEAAIKRGTPMRVYLGTCGHYHLARRRKK